MQQQGLQQRQQPSNINGERKQRAMTRRNDATVCDDKWRLRSRGEVDGDDGDPQEKKREGVDDDRGMVISQW